MIKAIFVDFYGTIVFEDGENVSRISDMIYKSGNAQSVSQIGSYWRELETVFCSLSDTYLCCFEY